MSVQYFFNVGHVPADHKGGYITCGDPDSSGTKETTFIVDDDTLHVTCIENQDFDFDAADSNFFSPKDAMYKALAEAVNNYFNVSTKIDEFTLASAWAYFQDEPLKKSKIQRIDADFGEFTNEGLKYNGKFYFRFFQREDDDDSSEVLAFAA